MKKISLYTILSFLTLSIILTVSLQSCTKPSFPKERIEDSIKKICYNEYDLEDVQVKISGKTVGTALEIDNLFDLKEGIDKEAAERIGNLLLSVSRVCISTDADFDFYVVIAADKKIPGMEAVFIRYVTDIKRFLVANISRDDFFQRLLIQVRYNPQMLARQSILQFFSLLSKGDSQKLMAKYLGKITDNKALLMSFLRIILEMKMKKDMHFKILEMKMRSISEEKTLVYCKVLETYKSKEGYTEKDFAFPERFINEYLFVVGAHNYSSQIIDFVPLFHKEDGIIKKSEIPDEYKKYCDFDNWSKKDVLLEDIPLEEFVAGQIAQRVTREITRLMTEDAAKKERLKIKGKEVDETPLYDFKISSLKGYYKKDEKQGNYFELDFTLSEAPNIKILPQDLIDVTLGETKKTLERYPSIDYQRIIMSSDPEKKIIRSFGKKALKSY